MLKRVTMFNELLKCNASGELIGPGDYYYEDDEDGTIIKATVYYRLEWERKVDSFDYSKLENVSNEVAYRQELIKAEREFLTQTIMDRPIYGRGK
jgi:hypothetical protein